jgi:hypothetical protein
MSRVVIFKSSKMILWKENRTSASVGSTVMRRLVFRPIIVQNWALPLNFKQKEKE